MTAELPKVGPGRITPMPDSRAEQAAQAAQSAAQGAAARAAAKAERAGQAAKVEGLARQIDAGSIGTKPRTVGGR